MFLKDANKHCALNSAPVEDIRPIHGRGSDRGRVPITGSYGTVGSVPGHLNEVCSLRYPSTAEQ